MMKVALGQFVVAPEWQTNIATCIDLMTRASDAGADLLVLPEGVLARDITDPDLVLKTAQPLDGPFVSQMLVASQGSALTTMVTVHVPDGTGRALNVLIVVRDGAIIARYDKLHLYDAFAVKESTNVTAGQVIPPLVEVAGFKLGLMTCYDVRFPELARSLALAGADAFVLPAAWVKGPQKEHHWQVLCTARALENTCYMVAVGECGPRNIGNSLVVDPLGVVMVKLSEVPALVFAKLDRERINSARAQLPVLDNTRFAPPVLK